MEQGSPREPLRRKGWYPIELDLRDTPDQEGQRRGKQNGANDPAKHEKDAGTAHGSRLTVELSGARAGVLAWHFILHASAPTRC
jgi:hypothetical protein